MTGTIELVSMYLGDGVGGHHISLSLKDQGDETYKGTIHLDPNACTLNAFGDRGMCTLMYAPPHDVVASRQRLGDPAGLGRRYYELTWEGQTGIWALICFPKEDVWYLVVTREREGRRVVALYPKALFQADPVGTVQTRYGLPIRDVIARGDLDEMRAEAATVRSALTALDQRDVVRRALPTDKLDEVRAALADLDAAIAAAGG